MNTIFWADKIQLISQTCRPEPDHQSDLEDIKLKAKVT